MASENHPSTIAIVLAVISAAGGLFASFIRWRQHVSAKASARHAAESEKRRIAREVQVTATEIIAEGGHIDSLLANLRKQYQTLFAFAGQSSGPSKMQAYLDEWESTKQRVQHFLDEAKQFIGAGARLTSASSEDLSSSAARLQTGLVEVKALRTSLARKVDELASQNAASRERALNRPMPDRSSGVNPNKPFKI